MESMEAVQNTLDEKSIEKDELEMSIENQRALMSQMEAQLNKHKMLIDSKESKFASQAHKLSKEKELQVTNVIYIHNFIVL